MNFILRKIKEAGERKFGEAQRKAEAAYVPSADLETSFDLPYSAPDGAALFADFYRPRGTSGAETLPVAVMVHGGGLFSGSRRSNRVFCEILARKGFLVFVPEYRLLDAADGISEISDLYAGLTFLRDNLEKYGGDPRRIYLFGESAGAYLSLYAAAAIRQEPLRRLMGCPELRLSIRGLVGLSGMYYTTRFDPIGLIYRKDLYGRRRSNRDLMRWMDPEKPEVVSALPPVLLTSSGEDYLKQYTLRYAEALKTRGHACELLYYPEGKDLIHAFPSRRPELPESVDALSRILRWIQNRDGGKGEKL